MPVRVPEAVKVSLEPYAEGELRHIKQTSHNRFRYMLRKRPCKEGFLAFGAPQRFVAEGPLGQMKVAIHSFIDVQLPAPDSAMAAVTVMPKCGGKTKLGRTMMGTTRSYIDSAVRGVSLGFRKELELHGVGYRARIEDRPEGGQNLVLRVGFSHEIVHPIPPDVSIAVPNQTSIVVLGPSKMRVGTVAGQIRNYRKPDPYKGKGVRYAGQVLKLKPGKRK